MDVGHDIRDRIQIHIGSRDTACLPSSVLKLAGSAYHVGLAVFVEIHITQNEIF